MMPSSELMSSSLKSSSCVMLHRLAENSRMDFSFETQFRSAAFLSAFDEKTMGVCSLSYLYTMFPICCHCCCFFSQQQGCNKNSTIQAQFVRNEIGDNCP